LADGTMRPPDRRKAASVSLDLESSATFWKKLMIEEASTLMWYSEPKMAGHFRALAASAAATSARVVDMAVMRTAVRLPSGKNKNVAQQRGQKLRLMLERNKEKLRVDCLLSRNTLHTARYH